MKATSVLSTALLLVFTAVSLAELPADKRLAPPKDLNGYFPFTPSDSPEAWAKRAAKLRRHAKVALGLYPEPPRTPLNAVIHGKIDRGDYTVERVYFESLPGFYVTGSLYRPVGKPGRRAGIACPHGHWNNGRFYLDGGIDAAIKSGAEKFKEGGRSPLQARSVHLARMGCVVFLYDMLGNADSVQISHHLAHRFAKQRPSLNKPDSWGLYGTQAELRLQNIMGLQTWNSIRVLDFLESLPDVDPKRLGATGASGGGTQSFLLSALDERVAAAFPAVMVSTAMQGGCTCENASLLRIPEGNVGYAALIAPRPLGLTTANDWTKEMSTKGFPELKQHYAMLGVPDKLMLHDRTEFGHNYNLPSRMAMYAWFNKHLNLGVAEPIEERDYKLLSLEEATVWTEEHPKPSGGDAFETKLTAQIDAQSRRQIDADPQIARDGWSALLDADPALAGTSELDHEKTEHDGYFEMRGRLTNTTWNEQLPVVFLHPGNWNGHVVLRLDARGKAALFGADNKPTPEVAKLLAAGASVIGVDLLFQGEFLADGKPLTKTRRVDNPREFAGYTFGYNHPLLVHRVHDVLTIAAHAHNHDLFEVKGFHLWVGKEMAAVGAAAAFSLGDWLTSASIDTGGFRFAKIDDLQDPDFLPGAVKYGDLPFLLANAKGKLRVAGEKEAPADGVVDWLLKNSAR